MIIVICALIAVVDGFDTQSIGLVAPAIAAAWQLRRPVSAWCSARDCSAACSGRWRSVFAVIDLAAGPP